MAGSYGYPNPEALESGPKLLLTTEFLVFVYPGPMTEIVNIPQTSGVDNAAPRKGRTWEETRSLVRAHPHRGPAESGCKGDE